VTGRRKRPAFFSGWWLDENGVRLRRVRREEMTEVWRLWTRHRDIREGRVRA
jgi:hypothetical protein